jgi:hypothetical protein
MILKGTVNVYLAMRAILLLIKHGAAADGMPIRESVQTLAVSGLGTGVGKVPAEIYALQMKVAYDEVRLGKSSFPTSWSNAQVRHQHLPICYAYPGFAVLRKHERRTGNLAPLGLYYSPASGLSKNQK